ncbi:hypothetical protein SLA2020_346080 [Shorea laevis]
MDFYVIETEAEILNGNILKMSKCFNKRRDMEAINYAVKSLRKEARTWFNKGFSDSILNLVLYMQKRQPGIMLLIITVIWVATMKEWIELISLVFHGASRTSLSRSRGRLPVCHLWSIISVRDCIWIEKFSVTCQKC